MAAIRRRLLSSFFQLEQGRLARGLPACSTPRTLLRALHLCNRLLQPLGLDVKLSLLCLGAVGGMAPRNARLLFSNHACA